MLLKLLQPLNLLLQTNQNQLKLIIWALGAVVMEDSLTLLNRDKDQQMENIKTNRERVVNSLLGIFKLTNRQAKKKIRISLMKSLS